MECEMGGRKVGQPGKHGIPHGLGIPGEKWRRPCREESVAAAVWRNVEIQYHSVPGIPAA